MVMPLALASASLTVGLGFVKTPSQRVASDFQLNLRSGTVLGVLKPTLGLEMVQGSLGYGWGGVSMDVPLDDRLALRSGVALGFYMDERTMSVGERFRTRVQMALDYHYKPSYDLGLGLQLANNTLGFTGFHDVAANVRYTVLF